MIRRPPRSTHCISSAASDVYKRQGNINITLNTITVIGSTSSLRGPTTATSTGNIVYNIPVAVNPPRAAWSNTPGTTQTTAGGSYTMTLSFTNASGTAVSVTGLSTSDFTTNVVGACVTGVSGSGSSYTITVTIPTSGSGSIAVTLAANSVALGSVRGPANAVISPSTLFSIPVVVVNPPTATWSGEPTNVLTGGSITLTLTFSEAVTGLTQSDLSTSAGSVGVPSGSGTTYSVPITLPTTGQGSFTVSLRANAVRATATNLDGPTAITTSDSISYTATKHTQHLSLIHI